MVQVGEGVGGRGRGGHDGRRNRRGRAAPAITGWVLGWQLSRRCARPRPGLPPVGAHGRATGLGRPLPRTSVRSKGPATRRWVRSNAHVRSRQARSQARTFVARRASQAGCAATAVLVDEQGCAHVHERGRRTRLLRTRRRRRERVGSGCGLAHTKVVVRPAAVVIRSQRSSDGHGRLCVRCLCRCAENGGGCEGAVRT
jgi:hypothetical protein